jgi:GT2 family glycosyltransferase
MDPQVSVIIPTYNRRRMLREAVRSVLAQREVAFELIIVDDGSTDSTWEDLHHGEMARLIATAPCNSDVRTERIPHSGVAAARNRGAALARAEYIAFLDSDDQWAPEKLVRQHAYMREHPRYPLVQTQEIWTRNGRRVNPGLRHQKHAGDIFEASLHLCLISCSAVMMRAERFHQAGGFDQRMIACEDYDLWLRIVSRYPAGLLDQALVTRHGGHPDQLSASPALDRFRIRALLKLLALYDMTARQKIAAGEVLAKKCAIYAKGLTRRGRVEQAAFYSNLGCTSRAWVACGIQPNAEYWLKAFELQPLNSEAP